MKTNTHLTTPSMISLISMLLVIAMSLACGGGGGGSSVVTTSAAFSIPNFSKVEQTQSQHTITWQSQTNAMGTDLSTQVGASNLILRVVDANGSAVDNLSQISIKPIMNMGTHLHGTPMSSISNLGSGNYQVELFYLMMTSPEMGYWTVEVDLGLASGNTDLASFYPSVSMNMARPTPRATFTGNADAGPTQDTINSMSGGTEGRSYYLFPKALKNNGSSYDLTFFLAARQNMMTYPVITTGSSLTQSDGSNWTVNSVAIEVQEGSQTAVNAAELGQGYYKVNLPSLSTTGSANINVSLSINGVAKSSGGQSSSLLSLPIE
jgi:hypothetical protein